MRKIELEAYTVAERLPECHSESSQRFVLIREEFEKEFVEAVYCKDDQSFRYGSNENPIDTVAEWCYLPRNSSIE